MSSDIMAPHVCARNPDVANKLKAHTKVDIIIMFIVQHDTSARRIQKKPGDH
jgi:hypothetical protein